MHGIRHHKTSTVVKSDTSQPAIENTFKQYLEAKKNDLVRNHSVRRRKKLTIRAGNDLGELVEASTSMSTNTEPNSDVSNDDGASPSLPGDSDVEIDAVQENGRGR